jgi:hypothetical protein
MICGNGKDRTQHPIETFGSDWMEFGQSSQKESASAAHERNLPPRRPGNDDLND